LEFLDLNKQYNLTLTLRNNHYSFLENNQNRDLILLNMGKAFGGNQFGAEQPWGGKSLPFCSKAFKVNYMNPRGRKRVI